MRRVKPVPYRMVAEVAPLPPPVLPGEDVPLELEQLWLAR